jgi:hypothetical protein
MGDTRGTMDKRNLTERDITKFILPAVKHAGWDEMLQVREEVYFKSAAVLGHSACHLLVHREAAAFAISFRFLADMPAARAFPPMRPSATAAAFFPSSVVTSSISPDAILAIVASLSHQRAMGTWPAMPRPITTEIGPTSI